MANWLCSKEGAGLEAKDAAIWLCNNEGADEAASWLYSKEGAAWGAKRVANWLYTTEGGVGREAKFVANWLYSDKGADWGGTQVASRLYSKEGAGWKAERVAGWLFCSIATWYEHSDGHDGANIAANWLCSKDGALWDAERAAKWLCSLDLSDPFGNEVFGHVVHWLTFSLLQRATSFTGTSNVLLTCSAASVFAGRPTLWRTGSTVTRVPAGRLSV